MIQKGTSVELVRNVELLISAAKKHSQRGRAVSTSTSKLATKTLQVDEPQESKINNISILIFSQSRQLKQHLQLSLVVSWKSVK